MQTLLRDPRLDAIIDRTRSGQISALLCSAIVAFVCTIIAGGCGKSTSADAPSRERAAAPASKAGQSRKKIAAPPAQEASADQTTPVAAAAPRVEPRPQPRYRDADNRPRHDDEALAALGIQKYESR